MENASKALLIAGSILVGMIVISIFYFSFGQAGHLVGEVDENSLQEEVKAFNDGFEAYNKKLMYGIDVVSVLNKAIDNNRKYEDYPVYTVNVKFTYDMLTGEKSTDPKKVETDYKTYSLNDKDQEIWIKSNILSKITDKYDNFIHNFKVAAFRCTSVSYVTKKDTNDTLAIGRIKEITFEQRK